MRNCTANGQDSDQKERRGKKNEKNARTTNESWNKVACGTCIECCQVPTFTDGSLLERCPAVASLARRSLPLELAIVARWCSAVGSVLKGEAGS